ncbi:MAG: hypothetical protein CME60_04140 [Halobacteriovoraceae bacterium]|nr:hypothetical protein [Halobacteriovoraceae bacterium]
MSEGSLSPIIVKYEKLLDEDPRSRSFAPLAEAYRQVGLIDKAFDVLKKGLRYNPEYLLGYLTLALCYLDKNEYGLAYSTLKPLIASNRDNLKLHKVFAECAKKTNNLEEALDSYKYLLFLNPRDSEIANQVSLLEEELHEEAVYSKAETRTFNVEELKPNPEDDKEIDNWVQVDLASKEELESDEDDWELGVPEESDSFTNQKESSENSVIHFENGESTEEDLDQDDSHDFIYDKSDYSSVMENEPNRGDLIYQDEDNDGEFEQEEDDNLIAFKRTSLEEAEKEVAPVITHTLVDIYLKQGHYAKAKEILAQILEVGPATKEAQDKMAEIDKLLGTQQGPSKEDENSEDLVDEGRDNLMAAFDKNFGEEEEAESQNQNNYDSLMDDLDIVFKDYLSEIKSKHDNFHK